MRELVLRMLREGLRPFEIAQRLSISYDVVHEIALNSGIRYAGKHLTLNEKNELLRLREIEGLPIRSVALAMGISKTTVGRWSRERYLRVQDDGGTAVTPSMLKVPRGCPRHGLIRLWPCVACAADPI